MEMYNTFVSLSSSFRKIVMVLTICLIPSFALAHAGVYDRYLSALPSYNALISVPSGIFYCMHGLLLICILVYYLMHKFRGYNVPCIQIPHYNFHENIKLLITTILLSIGLTPVLFISSSFLGAIVVLVFILSILYFIAILFSKIRKLLVSGNYTFFLITTVFLQTIYYASYYAFSLWENNIIKEWFKVNDELFPNYTYTIYPDRMISIPLFLENFLGIAFFFVGAYLVYLLVCLCRFIISKNKKS